MTAVPALLARLGVRVPIVQAPMASAGSPALAAAVSSAGAVGSIAVGTMTPEQARAEIRAVRRISDAPFNVNVFCHAPPVPDPAREAAWIARLASELVRLRATPPARLREIYSSFVGHDAMLAVLLDERPAVVSFHFGLPLAAHVAALRTAGIVLLATATSVAEARAAAAAGVDVVVAQGFEAGGHRGVFDPDAPDERLDSATLTRRIRAALPLPVIAAGGIVDGTGIAAAFAAGATAVQLGTAFLACPESAIDADYRARLAAPDAATVMTRAYSGRPGRSLVNGFTALTASAPDASVPAYPIAYDAAKQVAAAAASAGVPGLAAQWAGTGVPRVRALPAAELVAVLVAETDAAVRTSPGTAAAPR